MTTQRDRMLTDAEINHLRRLVSWLRCNIGPSPEEHVEIVRDIAPQLRDIGDEGKQRLVERHELLKSVPKDVRASVKALGKTVRRCDAKAPPQAEEVEPASLPPTTRALAGPTT